MRKEKKYYDVRLYAFPYSKKESSSEQFARIVVNATKYFDSFSKYEILDLSDLPRLMKQLLIVKDFSDTDLVIQKLNDLNLVDEFLKMLDYIKTRKIIENRYVFENDYEKILKCMNIIYLDLTKEEENER